MQPKSLLLLITSGVLTAASSSTPRGVSPDDAKLYYHGSSDTFTCLTHPSITIPFSRVNDDYCDCPDGSDEPGTAACANLSPRELGIRGFYCANDGHTPAYLPLSRVNDGVCDYDICCDGSDEYAGVGGVKCPSKCAEIGAAARKLAEKRGKVRAEGGKARAELVKRAGVLRKEIEDNLATTKANLAGAEKQLEQLKTELKEVEEREKEKAAKSASGAGRKVKIALEQAREKVERYRETVRRLKEERDEAERKLKETEEILRKFKEEYNPNFNDEGVKRASRAWEEYLANGNEPRVVVEEDEKEVEELVESEVMDWDELADEIEAAGEAASGFIFDAYLPDNARDWIHNKFGDIRQMLVDNGLLAGNKDADVESKAVTQARDRVSSVERQLEEHSRKIKDLQGDLEKSYGPDDVFRALKGTCISRESGEYRYEYCFLEKGTQISMKDNSRISLGNFARIEQKDANSKNEASGVFESGWEEAHEEPLSGMVLKHENGQQCWNGPKRSVAVELYCSLENEIRSVVEAEKCVYRFEVGTPAVCEPATAEQAKTGAVRDEL